MIEIVKKLRFRNISDLSSASILEETSKDIIKL